MFKNTLVQFTGLTDVRLSKKCSRVRMALASAGIASTLLIGGLFGSTGIAHAASMHTYTPATQHVTLSAHAARTTTIPVSYSASSDYVSDARQAAAAAGISPDLFVSQIQRESGFNPNVSSPAGAVGIAQFMPSTAASMGVNPYNPTEALNGGARLMANLSSQFGGDYAKALAAYNGGSGAVTNAVNTGGANWLAYMPAESQNYVHTILG